MSRSTCTALDDGDDSDSIRHANDRGKNDHANQNTNSNAGVDENRHADCCAIGDHRADDTSGGNPNSDAHVNIRAQYINAYTDACAQYANAYGNSGSKYPNAIGIANAYTDSPAAKDALNADVR